MKFPSFFRKLVSINADIGNQGLECEAETNKNNQCYIKTLSKKYESITHLCTK